MSDRERRANVWLAILASAFYPGAGQMYAESWRRGIILTVLATVGLFLANVPGWLAVGISLALATWIVSIVEAPWSCRRHDRRHGFVAA